MAAQTALWALAAGGAAVSGVSALADRRRIRRRDLDRVGWVPWPLVQILALLTAIVAAGLAING